MKKCTQCGKELPATSEFFPTSKQVKCGLRSACRDCTAAKRKTYVKKYYKENKDKVNAKNRDNYYKRHPKDVVPDGMKRCSVCNLVKSVNEFGKLSKNKDGLRGQCKACRHQEYLANADDHKEKCREWYKKNKERVYYKGREYRENNPEWYQQNNRDYYSRNKEKIKTAAKNSLYRRMKEDKGFLILQRCRKRMYDALKGYSKTERTQKLIGCTPQELKGHLEKQFSGGMSWENYGEWHVDHIIPCAAFDFTKKEQQFKCFHYTNLQPLWASENISKSDKVNGVSCRSMEVV